MLLIEISIPLFHVLFVNPSYRIFSFFRIFLGFTQIRTVNLGRHPTKILSTSCALSPHSNLSKRPHFFLIFPHLPYHNINSTLNKKYLKRKLIMASKFDYSFIDSHQIGPASNHNSSCYFFFRNYSYGGNKQ